VHIGRKHGSGDPVEKGDSDQARRPFSFLPYKRNKNGEYSQTPNNNRYNGGYKTVGNGNDDFGAMIDHMYRLLTYFEENIYKTGEIKRIAHKHNSSMTPKWFPLTNYDPQNFANAFQTWLSEAVKTYHSSKQRHSDTTVAASSHQEIKKTSLDLSSNVEKGNTHQSSSSVNPVPSKDELESYLETLKENGGWKEEDGWMVKRDMYGDVRDLRKLRDKSFLMPCQAFYICSRQN
jgi:hypothetical protein